MKREVVGPFANQFDVENIIEILHHPSVVEHITTMLDDKGPVRPQKSESGFAVYNNPEGLQVSGLIIPKVTEVSVDSKELWDQTTSIDIAPLVRKKVDSLSITKEEINSDNEAIDDALLKDLANRENHTLSDRAQIAIRNIKQDPELLEHEKQSLCEQVFDKDYIKAQGGDNIRSDISLLAHNHPTDPNYKLNELLIPSLQDLTSYMSIRKHNPTCIEMIVAKDSKGKSGAILYAAGESSNISVEQHYIESGRNNIAGKLGQLSISGFEHVVLNLRRDGKPYGYKQKIRDFVGRLTD